jgi:hypothetical protein
MRLLIWLRRSATSRMVTGSVSDVVFEIYYWPNASDRTMALGSTHRLTEVSTWDPPWEGKGVRCLRLATLPPPCANCLKILCGL